MKTLILLSILLGVGLSQHPLLGDIPSKIHMEIFGSPLRSPFTFPRTPSSQNVFLSASSFPSGSISQIPLSTSLLHHPLQLDYQRNLLQNFTVTTPRVPQVHELFAPAIVKTPAATKGQIEAYMKALREEAEQELKDQMKQQQQQQQQQQQDGQQFGLGYNQRYLVSNLEPKAVSYVNVKLGGMQNIKYHYLS